MQAEVGPRVRGPNIRVLVGLVVGAVAAVAGVEPPARAQAFVAPGALVVNEIDYDQPGADDAEFVEIKNTTDEPVFLGDVDIVGINGLTAPGTEYLRIELPNVTLGAGDYYVVGAAGVANVDLIHGTAGFVQNGAPDAVAVVTSVPSGPANDYLIDSVSYEGDTAGGPGTGGFWTEGSGLGLDDSSTASDVGLSRVPDGVDTAMNNVDLVRSCITPGETNTSVGTGCLPGGGTINTPTASPEPPATATSAPSATATSEPPATATSAPSATATSEPPATATSEPPATTTSQPPTATSIPAGTATSVPATDTPPATAIGGPPTQGTPATATPASLAVELAELHATRMSHGVLISWATLSEIDHAGFHVVRQMPGSTARLTPRLIRPRGGVLGAAAYRLLDDEAPAGTATYWLIDVDTWGRATWHGPARVAARKNTSLPVADPH